MIPKLFEEYYEPHFSLENDHTRNPCFNFPQVRLDAEQDFYIFRSMNVLVSLLPSLCAHV